MSLIARTKYLAVKVNELTRKIQPTIDAYNQIMEHGAQDMVRLLTQKQTTENRLNDLENIPEAEKTYEDRKAIVKLRQGLNSINTRVENLQKKINKHKNRAVGSLSNIVNKSIDSVSGATADVEIVPPDEITGEGGSFSVTPKPELFDENTDLVKDTITSPETVAVTTVTGITSDGKPVTGQGTTTPGSITTT